MAENKKSVLLYCDIIHTVKELSNEEAGKLFKHYLEYINDLNPTSDRLTELLFEPIKQNLKRDLKKWEDKSIKNREIANIRWQKKDAIECERIKKDAIYADKDTVTVTVTDKVTVKDKISKDIYRSFAHLKLSFLEFDKLKAAGYSQIQIDNILNQIENYAKNKNYKNLYLTAINWLNKETQTKPISKIEKGLNDIEEGKNIIKSIIHGNS
jgi:hypothetical protein